MNKIKVIKKGAKVSPPEPEPKKKFVSDSSIRAKWQHELAAKHDAELEAAREVFYGKQN
jgi:hypothetical protein